MKIRIVVSLALLLLVGTLMWPRGAPVQAQDAPIKVELTPTAVELPPRGEVQAQVTLRNKSQGALQNIKLVWFTDTGVVIRADESQDLPALAPQAEVFWTLHLAQNADGLIPGNIYFRVSYSTAGAAQVLYGTLGVNTRQTDEVNKVVEVVPHTASTLLNEQRPGQVFLVINNKSNQPIRVGQITTRGPDFITGTPDMTKLMPDQQGFVQLGARDSAYVPVQIKVTDAVTPGKHLLIFQVPVEWGAQEHQQKASVIAQQEFDVGILGESELLTALGLPSFLILPGFLMLVTFRLLNKGGAGEESVLTNATNPALWVGAITLSGVMAFLYPYGTKWFGGVSRNYLVSYGLGDIVRVWLVSILIGMFAWAGYRLGKFLWRYLLQPAESDKPVWLLIKLCLRGLGVSLYQMTVKIDGEDCLLFQVDRRREGQETYWVAPFIEIEWLPPAATLSEKAQAARQKFMQQVADQLGHDGSACKLAWRLMQGKRKGLLEATWQATAGLTGPREVKKDDVTPDSIKGVIAVEK